MKNILMGLLCLSVNGSFSFGQNMSNSDFLRSQAQKVISFIEQNNGLTNDKIVFSMLNGKYYLVLNDECKEWFVRFMESDNVPVILDNNKNALLCHKMFKEGICCWDGTLTLDSLSIKHSTLQFIGNNISYFAYFGKNGQLRCEYILPFFSSENPLKENYDFLIREMLEMFYKFG